MEIKAYLRFFRKRWWIIVAALAVTIGATAFITFRTPPVYQASATYLVGVSSATTDQKSRISALDLLTNRNEIGGTYARLANSRTIKSLAAKELGWTSTDNLSVTSQVVSGSNVLEITVEGRDPVKVRDFANAIGDQTAKYVQTLTESYELQPLDKAVVPGSPASPGLPGNLMLGGILGLVLGFALAALAEYLGSPAESVAGFNILDERTGIFNTPYFMLRLRQEMGRTKRNGHALSVALLNIDHGNYLRRISAQTQNKALRAAAAIVGPSLRNEDVLAAYDESHLIILLPDAENVAAKNKVERLVEKLSFAPLELNGGGSAVNLHLAAGVASYRREKVGQDKTAEDLVLDAQRALRESESAVYGGVTAESMPESASESMPAASEQMAAPADASSAD